MDMPKWTGESPERLNTTQRITGNYEKQGAGEVAFPRKEYTIWLSSNEWLV